MIGKMFFGGDDDLEPVLKARVLGLVGANGRWITLHILFSTFNTTPLIRYNKFGTMLWSTVYWTNSMEWIGQSALTTYLQFAALLHICTFNTFGGVEVKEVAEGTEGVGVSGSKGIHEILLSWNHKTSNWDDW